MYLIFGNSSSRAACSRYLRPDDVRVEPGTADVLADFVQQQHVGLVKRQAGHPLAGLPQQLLLAAFELSRRHTRDAGRLVVRVLQDGQARQDVAPFEYFAGDAAEDLAEAEILNGLVIDQRSGMFAQADEHHLHQAALDVADEPCVRFDPPAHEHVIGLRGVAIEMHRETLGRAAHHHGFHAGSDRAAAGVRCDAVRFQYPPLAFGGAASMAAHGRHDERLAPSRWKCATAARKITAMLATPRLPAVMATR